MFSIVTRLQSISFALPWLIQGFGLAAQETSRISPKADSAHTKIDTHDRRHKASKAPDTTKQPPNYSQEQSAKQDKEKHTYYPTFWETVTGTAMAAFAMFLGKFTTSHKVEEPAPTAPLILTDDNFDKVVLENDHLALVDFWAPWCNPCKQMTPIVQHLAKAYAGRMTIAKLNVDDHESTSRTYGITSIPTFLFFKGGEEIKRIEGARTEENLRQHIEQHL